MEAAAAYDEVIHLWFQIDRQEKGASGRLFCESQQTH